MKEQDIYFFEKQNPLRSSAAFVKLWSMTLSQTTHHHSLPIQIDPLIENPFQQHSELLKLPAIRQLQPHGSVDLNEKDQLQSPAQPPAPTPTQPRSPAPTQPQSPAPTQPQSPAPSQPRSHAPSQPPDRPQPRSPTQPRSPDRPRSPTQPRSPDRPRSPEQPQSPAQPQTPTQPRSHTQPSTPGDDDDDFNSSGSDTSDLQFSKFGSAEETPLFSLEGLKFKVNEWKKTIGEKMQRLLDTKHQNENLTQNVTNLLLQKQYNTSSYKLPVVIKSIKPTAGIKPPRGLYYMSKSGRKVYLNQSQRQKWLNGDEIAGCIDGCSSEFI